MAKPSSKSKTSHKRGGGKDRKPRNWARFLALLEEGYSIVEACKRAAIGRSTVYQHCKKNADSYGQVHRARDIGDNTLEALVQDLPRDVLTELLARLRGELPSDPDAPQPHWSDAANVLKTTVDAAKWLLAVHNPSEYSLTRKMELTGKDGAPVVTPQQPQPVETDAAFMSNLAAALAKLDATPNGSLATPSAPSDGAPTDATNQDASDD